jgi:type IV pilus assembly protein PilV
MANLTQYTRHRAARIRGFTLIEVLVSLVILSIGLLGMAKLMLVSSRANDSAYLRSQATTLAYEMLDNMRANSVQATAVPSPYATALGAAATNPGFACIGAAACPNLALYDVYQWKLHLGTPTGALPAGQGSVVTTPAGSKTNVVITVQWDDSVAQASFGAAANLQTIVLETIL